MELWTYYPLNEIDIKLKKLNITKNITENEMFFNKISGLNGGIVSVSMESDALRAIPVTHSNNSRYFGIDGELAELMQEK